MHCKVNVYFSFQVLEVNGTNFENISYVKVSIANNKYNTVNKPGV